MNTLEALKFFRKKKRISQANMLPGKDAKRYHRLESGQSKLDYEDLFTALNTLELSFKEFFGAIDMEENIPILAIDNQYKNCLYTLDDSAGKKILLRYFHELAAIKEKTQWKRHFTMILRLFTILFGRKFPRLIQQILNMS